MTFSAVQSEIRPVQWNGHTCVLIDQTVLPGIYRTIEIRTSDQMATAIRTMIVRGAPAIGVAAAFGMVLGWQEAPQGDPITHLERVAATLRATRPTAVNLFWAIDRMLTVARRDPSFARLEREATAILEGDIATCRAIGEHGLLALPAAPERLRLLTHCNAGALATAGYGTALGVVRSAHRADRLERVYADETRPRLQGARLTAWELVHERIPVTVLADTMAAHVIGRGLVDAVVVGADRIAANGDTANKIGTCGVAIIARHYGVPFFVAAPWSTVDLNLSSGEQIPIEQRDSEEMRAIEGVALCPQGVEFYNPAFDVTPASLVTGIIVESGVYAPGELAAAGQVRLGR
ncbi:S-methyl-5-thioribose-1-phosphate isomerase [Gloeobacter violaceus]|uniref:Methylthioribose-1-phosphate isomerase n=1 Tax=Gloeobacter violaceus (strain ATCC 29082 / PCC 7421) TaxID=251221 RepID=MTNA_GLOVI|nr:S-methyl-5-thioribose-1-phosphate isomerase [Gloeobacter violaceus]Q7NP62.1 RecName: Full=Methylthioribose-1-phosphate isomerase; Short=M1Pi; Short=MTR-1-P isomerase; AltName: Full=S-methyl-5-thioribose-1-phosphate isomerase [Gloeobacter violaceus PCC 7421]BAC88136.1 translation initiation factor IF-2B alpha subunit [Gloeobacter violaceus PCC 7421]